MELTAEVLAGVITAFAAAFGVAIKVGHKLGKNGNGKAKEQPAVSQAQAAPARPPLASAPAEASGTYPAVLPGVDTTLLNQMLQDWQHEKGPVPRDELRGMLATTRKEVVTEVTQSIRSMVPCLSSDTPPANCPAAAGERETIQ